MFGSSHSRHAALLRVLVCLSVIAVLCPLGGCDALSDPKPTPTPDPWHGQIDYMTQPDEAAARIEEWARTTHGDASKLNHDQLMWLNGMTVGHAKVYLASRYKLQVEEEAKKKKSSHPAVGKR